MKKTTMLIALVLAFTMMFGLTARAETVVVGTNPEFAPFEFIGDDGQPTGIDMDLIKAVFEKVDPAIEVKIESMAFDGLVPALTSGKIDMAIAAMTITEEKKKNVLFSDPYYEAAQVIIIKDGSDVQGEADLQGKKIGVQMGTTGDYYVTDNVADAQVERFDKVLDAIQDVAAGRLDAVVVDDGPAQNYISQIAGLVILPEKMSDEQYGIAMKLEDTELCAKINEALAAMKEDGSLQAIFDKYEDAE